MTARSSRAPRGRESPASHPSTRINCLFLNSDNNRLTNSRVVPMISVVSSCVIVSFTCDEPSSVVTGFVDHESNGLANFSDGDTANPRVRISSYAV